MMMMMMIKPIGYNRREVFDHDQLSLLFCAFLPISIVMMIIQEYIITSTSSFFLIFIYKYFFLSSCYYYRLDGPDPGGR